MELTVACWVGTATSRERFDAALRAAFSDDGDFLGSEWSRAFGIGRYEEGPKESAWREHPTRSLRDLLQGISYEADVLGPLERVVTAMPESNAFVLLYDRTYEGDTRLWETEGIVMRFVGNVHSETST